MESSEGVDDQGSGWLQVKKKHKSSLKFSLHGWVGGVSGKQGSNDLHRQPSLNFRSGNSHVKFGRQPPKARGVLIEHGLDFVANSSSVSTEDHNVNYLDKCVVSQDECSSSPLLVAANATDSNCRIGDNREHPQIKSPEVLPKIKWGDLDDGLVLHCGDTVGPKIKFGGIEIDNLFRGKADNAATSTLCISTCIETQGLEATSAEADHAPRPVQNASFEENCKEVTAVSSEDVKIQITNEKVISQSSDVSSSRETHPEHFKAINDDIFGASSQSSESMICPAINETGMVVERPSPAVISEERKIVISALPVTKEGSSMVMSSQDSEALPPENSETLAESVATSSVEDCGDQKVEKILDNISKAHITSVIGDDMGESKERFRQRLWCFLFENLNRAVDELYLLCELECDLEQTKEAILVLEEAASDFKELNARVEEFEKVKRSSSQLIDGSPMSMKSDHRRPHALSWEVRRMTTSPHRAEILSSSLEAFRKIQQERVSVGAVNDTGKLRSACPNQQCTITDVLEKNINRSDELDKAKESVSKLRKQSGVSDLTQGNFREKTKVDSSRSSKVNLVENARFTLQKESVSNSNASRQALKESSTASVAGKSKRELLGSTSEMEKLLPRKAKLLTECKVEKNRTSVDHLRRKIPSCERDKETRNGNSWKSMDAWKEKRNWEDILSSPFRVSSRFSHSPGMSRKSSERARMLRDKLMSPEKKKKTALDLKKEAEEKHTRAMRIRSELENERVQKLQRTSEKLNRVNEWQAVRSMKLRDVMNARHQRSESRHEAFLAQVVRRAGDESSKVNEVRFITSLNEENKKFMLRQKLHDSELRRAEKLQVIKTKQKEDVAREEAVLERRRLIEAEKLQRLAETQRKKEEAQARREEERKASSAAREAKAMEQMRRKEIRAKAQQEEAELLAQRLAERLTESEQRRKFYLEQIRERASMDFRDQTSPLLRRSVNKEGQGRTTSTENGQDYQANNTSGSGGFILQPSDVGLQHSLKRRIKKIRQRLMALKHEFPETSVGHENAGIGYRTAVGTARAKIGRWLQELQRLRQARKEGAASIGLITAEMIKFLEGKDPELQASRQAGLLDFIASALPATHTSKPEACQVTIYLLRLLRVVLSVPTNRSYFLAQNLLPPIIPMLAAALENYIKIAASSNASGCTNLLSSKTSIENLESISEVLDGFLWTVAIIIGHISSDERQLQMQDDLLELVISYHVIHWLRDLFALHDRPQVEGSPFPSSILLSINLLAVLTSRYRTLSSIDWESLQMEKMSQIRNENGKLDEVPDFGCWSLCNSSGDHRLSSTVPLPYVPEDRPLDDSCNLKENDDSVSINQASDKVEFSSIKTDTSDIPHESHSVRTDDIAKCSVSQKAEKNLVDNASEQKKENKSGVKQSISFLLSAISETGLVCLPSLLTAVLLQANNRLCSEQASYVLPSNFEEVATGVLKVLNNLALIDITFIQTMLASLDLKMEFFHLMGFLLSHCMSKWGVANDKIGLLLLESLSLLGCFSLFHPENQAVLRWGKSPTILHKMCDLPFVFFSDPELMPILAGTLVAACYRCEQNKAVVQQELSMDMLLSLLKSCRNNLPAVRSNLTQDNPQIDESSESNQLGPESKKIQGDIPQRTNRHNLRSARISSGKAGANTRTLKLRNQKENKAMKLSDEMALKHNLSASDASSTLMLHSRYPESFIDKAAQFFAAEMTSLNDEIREDKFRNCGMGKCEEKESQISNGKNRERT